MNDATKQDHQRQFDRLADNELSDHELTRLLSSMESDASLWRLCALTLIEAQQMKGVMNDLVGESDAGSANQSTPALHRSADDGIRVAARISAMPHRALACVSVFAFLMFLLGWSIGHGTDESHQPVLTQTDEISDVPADSGAVTTESIAAGDSDAEPLTVSEGTRVIGHARIHRLSGESSLIPVLAGVNLDAAAFLHDSSQIPESVRRQARNNGFDVRGHREIVSVELFNGDELTIPLNELGVRYVGRQVF